MTINTVLLNHFTQAEIDAMRPLTPADLIRERGTLTATVWFFVRDMGGYSGVNTHIRSYLSGVISTSAFLAIEL